MIELRTVVGDRCLVVPAEKIAGELDLRLDLDERSPSSVIGTPTGKSTKPAAPAQ